MCTVRHSQRSFGRYQPLFIYRLMRQTLPIHQSAWTGWEAPDPAYWVPRGYVVINADLRGFHRSEGQARLLSQQEGEDYYDLIEWAGQQQWSSGKVGLLGISYLALTQWRAASLQPPSLAAICPWGGFTDPYRDLAYPGGVREDGFVLREFSDRFLDQLSGGQRQRAFVAMVLCQDTEYVLLDEPLNNLHMRHAVEMMKTRQRLSQQRGRTVIVVLRDINFASIYSDRILAMKDGALQFQGTPADLMTTERLREIYDLEIPIHESRGHLIGTYYF